MNVKTDVKAGFDFGKMLKGVKKMGKGMGLIKSKKKGAAAPPAEEQYA